MFLLSEVNAAKKTETTEPCPVDTNIARSSCDDGGTAHQGEQQTPRAPKQTSDQVSHPPWGAAVSVQMAHD